jgi:hypothetical protein
VVVVEVEGTAVKVVAIAAALVPREFLIDISSTTANLLLYPSTTTSTSTLT